MLRYVNNGPSDQTVLLAVGANGPVSGALFQLSVSIGEPLQNQSCVSARPLTDGLVLRNQDLSEGTVNPNPALRGSGAPSLFYKATLLEGQTLEVTLQGQIDPRFGQSPFQMIISDGCQSFNCQPLGHRPAAESQTNPGPGTRDVIIEVTTFIGLQARSPAVRSHRQAVAAARAGAGGAGGGPADHRGGRHRQLHRGAGGAAAAAGGDRRCAAAIPSEGRISPAALKFDGSNWGQPQVVTVTGVDDSERDGNQSYTVVVEKASSGDSRYAGIDGDDVQLINRDDEPGFALDQTRPAVTSESGGTATIPVTLNRAPTATVRLPISSSDPGEGQVQTAELVFEPTNWNQPQVIRVVGVDDTEMDGNQTYQLRLGPATSADPAYEGIDPPDLTGDQHRQRIPAGGGPADQRQAGVPVRPPADRRRSGRPAVRGHAVCGSERRGRIGPDGRRRRARHPAARPSSSLPSRDGGAADLRPGQLGGPAAFVATSADGGRTFGIPVNTGWQLSQMRIAGTTTENAVLAMLGPVGAMVLRTTDAGATWQPPSMLGSGFGNLRLAASGQTVVVTFDGDNGPAVWVSSDGGRTFNRRFVTDLPSTMAVACRRRQRRHHPGGLRRPPAGPAQHRRRRQLRAERPRRRRTSPARTRVAVGSRSLFSADKDGSVTVLPLDNLSAGARGRRAGLQLGLPLGAGGRRRRQPGGDGEQPHGGPAAPAGPPPSPASPCPSSSPRRKTCRPASP